MMGRKPLKSPFPYFGGKALVAQLVWERLGDCCNYVEPFFGSGAVLLGRPTPFEGVETVNDIDGLVSNFWRATKADPEAVANHADWPLNENDLHARHSWLVGEKDSLQARLEGDPDYYDAKVAGWWAWGLACWIGREFCSGKGPWQSVEMDDGSRHLIRSANAGRGVKRRLVHIGNAGLGINRQRIHLGDAGRGVNRKRADHREALFDYFRDLSSRFRHVRVCCGDWMRIMGRSPMLEFNRSFHPIGVFLDPPYADTAERDRKIYRVDSESIAHAVRDWAVSHGDDHRYRICLAGYEGEHEMPTSWACIEGKGGRGHGYGGMSKTGYRNAGRERLWFSPHCLPGPAELFPKKSPATASVA